MNTKFVALLLLAVMACSLASCSLIDKITGKNPEATTTTAPVTTTVPSISDPLRTEPAKVTTTAPTPVETPVWGPETPIK